MIALFASNRPEFLRPCLQSLAGESGIRIFVDGGREGGDEVEKVCQESGFPFEVERSGPGVGWQRRHALQMFLDDESLGDYLVFSDSDIVYGPGAIGLLRRELDFWWAADFPIGMLSCGYHPRLKGCSVRERDGHRIMPNHGGEAATMMRREPLKKAGNVITLAMAGCTATLKNALAHAHHPRATLLTPLPLVQHVGALKSGLSAKDKVTDLLFYDEVGNPLNPRPDLFDLEENICGHYETKGNV